MHAHGAWHVTVRDVGTGVGVVVTTLRLGLMVTCERTISAAVTALQQSSNIARNAPQHRRRECGKIEEGCGFMGGSPVTVMMEVEMINIVRGRDPRWKACVRYPPDPKKRNRSFFMPAFLILYGDHHGTGKKT
jgi:hypothetical protein